MQSPLKLDFVVACHLFMALGTAFRSPPQVLPNQKGSSIDAVAKGGYTIQDCEGKPDLILIGTGSEVQLCIESAAALAKEGKKVRVVSMPCTEFFDEQPKEYQDSSQVSLVLLYGFFFENIMLNPFVLFRRTPDGFLIPNSIVYFKFPVKPVSVLIPGVPAVSVEAGVTAGWQKYSHAQVGIAQAMVHFLCLLHSPVISIIQNVTHIFKSQFDT